MDETQVQNLLALTPSTANAVLKSIFDYRENPTPEVYDLLFPYFKEFKKILELKNFQKFINSKEVVSLLETIRDNPPDPTLPPKERLEELEKEAEKLKTEKQREEQRQVKPTQEKVVFQAQPEKKEELPPKAEKIVETQVVETPPLPAPKYFAVVDSNTGKQTNLNQEIERAKEKIQSSGGPQAYVSAVAPTASMRAKNILETFCNTIIRQPQEVAKMLVGADSTITKQALNVELVSSPIPVVGGINLEENGPTISDYTVTPVQPVSNTAMLLAGHEERKSEDREEKIKGTSKILSVYGMLGKQEALKVIATSPLPLTKKEKDEIISIYTANNDPFLVATNALNATSKVKILLMRDSYGNIDLDFSAMPHYRGIRGLFFRAADMLGFGNRAKSAVNNALLQGVKKLTGKTIIGATGKGLFKTLIGKLGAAIGPEGWIATEILARVLDKLKDFWQKNKDNILKFALATAAVGALALGSPLAGAGLALAAFGPRRAARAAGNAIQASAGLAAASIAKPLAISMVSVPILVALIIFIINSGAYIVPGGVGRTGTQPSIPPVVSDISCPLEGGEVLIGSYVSGNAAYSHGSNDYWESIVRRGLGESCGWSLPQYASCYGPTDSTSVCDDKGDCQYYGYALDVESASSSNVLFPGINGQSLQWKFLSKYENGMYAFGDTTGQYTITFTHIVDPVTFHSDVETATFQSGDVLTVLEDIPQPHLHIEFQVGGVYQKPENYFCR